MHKFNEGDEYDKIYEVLSTFKKKLKTNNILNEKYKSMLENLNYEQHYWSRTAIDIKKIGHDCVRLMKRLIYYDRFYYDDMN